MEKSKNTTLLPLPHNPTKKQLRYMYPRLPYDVIQDELKDIMGEKRKNRSVLLKTEFEKLVKIIGFPSGYEKEWK